MTPGMPTPPVNFELAALVTARRADPMYRVRGEQGVAGPQIPDVTVERMQQGYRITVSGTDLSTCRQAMHAEAARLHLLLFAEQQAAARIA
jgi:hypothetical protein